MLKTIFWILFTLFLILSVLNFALIHYVPGIIYTLFSIVFLPPLNETLRARKKWRLAWQIKLIFAFLILWFTLGMSDLMQLFESKYPLN